MFCLNMSMQCFSVQQDVTANNSNGSIRRLDLHAPDIRRVVTRSRSCTNRSRTNTSSMEETEQVEVEGQRPEVYVPGGPAPPPPCPFHGR